MPSKRRPQARRARRPRAKTTRSTLINIAHPRRSRNTREVLLAQLSARSQGARDRGLHAIAAMRRNPSLSLSRAAKLEGVKAETVKKNFPLALKKTRGQFKATKSDQYQALLNIPDAYGNSVPVVTRSSEERKQVSQYLRDLGRYLRGKKDALARWHGKTIGDHKLVTAGRTVIAIEPALSDFPIYRTFNGGSA